MVEDGSVVTNAVFARDVPAMFTPSATQDAQFEALAKYIPAVSAAAGKVAALNRNNFDLNDDSVITRPNEWGRNHSQYGMSWLHSDMKDMSYWYVFQLYKHLSEALR